MVAAPRVHLIDGHVLIFRAYHSLPDMRAPDGTPTGAAYGFTGSLCRWLADERPDHAAVAFDHALTSFRNALEPGYKAGRTEPPEDLEPQFALCREAAEALGLACFDAPDFEADDVIATLCDAVLDQGARVLVWTSDKDLAQLVREDGSVQLADPAKGGRLDADGARAKFGVDPAQIPDWLGLVGDAVDTLPGVPGVGPKSAAALLGVFGRIEDVPADPAAWDGVKVRGAERLAARVEAYRERALRTRALATLRHDVPGVRARVAELAWRGADRAHMETLADRLGWGRIRDRVPRWRDEPQLGVESPQESS